MSNALRIGMGISLLALTMSASAPANAGPSTPPIPCNSSNLGQNYTVFRDNRDGTWYYFYYTCYSSGWVATGGDYCRRISGSNAYTCIPL